MRITAAGIQEVQDLVNDDPFWVNIEDDFIESELIDSGDEFDTVEFTEIREENGELFAYFEITTENGIALDAPIRIDENGTVKYYS